MPPDQADHQSPAPHGIAMWGAPGTGKTTFLAALRIGLSREQNGWNVVGADVQSREVLVKMTSTLTSERRFPSATQGIERYHWHLVKQADAGRRRGKSSGNGFRIDVRLIDPSGEVFSDSRASEELIDNLVDSRGILFLFDPIREYEDGDAYAYLHATLTRLAQRMVDSPEFADGFLPHHVAICITKFDELRVLEAAEKLRLIDPDPDDPREFPRVGGDDARDLFRNLCDVSATGNAELVLNTLELHFKPENIEYFVTSAIGFHVNSRTGVFDPDDFQNLFPEAAGSNQYRIRGPVYPINVVEPVLWLAQRLSPKSGKR